MLLMVLVPLLFAVIIGIILVAGRAKPQADLGPRAAAPGGAATGGVWNAQILGDGPIGAIGGTLGSESGTFHVGEGTLAFLPDAASSPTWSVPCPQVTARANGAFSFAGVVLTTPDGEIRCNVSREHINKYTRNSIKTLREPRYYREFVEALVANGAQAR